MKSTLEETWSFYLPINSSHPYPPCCLPTSTQSLSSFLNHKTKCINQSTYIPKEESEKNTFSSTSFFYSPGQNNKHRQLLAEYKPGQMAQTMLLTSGVSSHGLNLNIERRRPKSYSQISLPQLPTPSSSSSAFRINALFKSKTKAAPAKKVPSPPKPKVEDGIFGTSGGIGFTKANELFVGRVAMIGFAASLLGEAVTGKGILAQLNLETGIPIYEAEPLLLFFILFTLLGAIGALGDRGRFVDDPPTGLDKAVISPGKGFRSALGLKEGGPLFGFTKSNELFVGRLAQLGIAFSLIGEIITGKGALAQLNIETGVPISELEPLLLFNVAFFFFAALNPGTGKFVTDEEE